MQKELEVETATFITKWLMGNSVPFTIDFESSAIDRNLGLEALPRVSGYKVSVAGEEGTPQGLRRRRRGPRS